MWALQVSLLLTILISSAFFLQKVQYFAKLNSWFQVFCSGFCGAVLFLPLALLIDYFFVLDDWTEISNINQVVMLFIDEAIGVIPPVLITWLALNVPFILELNFRNNVKKESSDLLGQVELPEITEKFKEIGNDILYINSESHYLRVVTTLGENFILYNLSNAIKELEGYFTGLQTHRSFWVNRDHVKNLLKKGKYYQVEMSNGNIVPVSRRKISEVKLFFKDIL